MFLRTMARNMSCMNILRQSVAVRVNWQHVRPHIAVNVPVIRSIPDMKLPLPAVLGDWNNQFLHQHKQAATAALNEIKNVIVYKEGELLLWKNTNSDYCQVDKQQV